MPRKVKIENAIGLMIAHDMTRIVPGKCEEVAFERGHIVREEDIAKLLDMGKKHIFVEEQIKDQVHEEEAAQRLAAAFASRDFNFSKVKQGRINIISAVKGILNVNLELLRDVNLIKDIVLATRKKWTVCRQGTVAAGTKIVPLYIESSRLEEVELLCAEKGNVLSIDPFRPYRIGVVVTGSEVYSGRIQDKFGEVLNHKLEALGNRIEHLEIADDDEEMIASTILGLKAKGCDVIIACGGFAVDPDDVTLEGILRTGARVISHGAPVMPGAMFTLAYLGDIPVIGAPAAVIWNKATVLDVLLPRILAGQRINEGDIVALAHGGLCLGCERCQFPVCPFCS